MKPNTEGNQLTEQLRTDFEAAREAKEKRGGIPY